MILKYRNKKLYLLEATTNSGVKITKWNKSSIKSYKHVVYRRLLYKISLQLMAKLECFLKVMNICDGSKL